MDHKHKLNYRAAHKGRVCKDDLKLSKVRVRKKQVYCCAGNEYKGTDFINSVESSEVSKVKWYSMMRQKPE